jgi:DNA polymerase I-like protein with 3'-5' exonuclease and polymerase domains
MSIETRLGPYQCPFRAWSPDQGRVFDGRFAYDTETGAIDDERPDLVPPLVLATACDGQQGVFVPRPFIPDFFDLHAGIRFIAHGAAFDLKVTQAVLGGRLDLYGMVDQGAIWDTLVLKRLYALATTGHTARGDCGLQDCAWAHLGLLLPKDVKDAGGRDVRTGFGRYLGRPLEEISEVYLRYAACDPLATWHLFGELERLIRDVLQDAHRVWGYVGDDWLRSVIRRFGPLTHHVQLRASILVDVLRSNGIGLDTQRRAEKLEQVRVVMDEARERMRQRGFLVDQPGSAEAMQSILKQFAREHPDVELKLTDSGEKFSTAGDHLAELAAEDDFFAAYAEYKAAETLVSTYLTKMDRPRLHPRFGFLLETGRTYCGGGFNLQGLPRETNEKSATRTIRGAFVPGGDSEVFIDADLGQIELVVLGYALVHQFGLGHALHDLVNTSDVHRLIAAAVLGKEPDQVVKSERDSAKPVSFGRPVGMGADRIRQNARAAYGIELTTEQVQERIRAYHRLCPELDRFLEDEVDTGLALATALHMTPARYNKALGRSYATTDLEAEIPQSWLGGMLLKVLRNETPKTQGGLGRPYEPEEIDYFWGQAQRIPITLKKGLRVKLRNRQADKRLWEAVRNWAGRRSVFTITGRLRAGATFCSARNCVFQGAAADGAILGLWLVWRAGYTIVDFVHDQLVAEAPADDHVPERVAEIKDLMRKGMLMVVPGMNVKVETVVTRSLNKSDLDPRYQPGAARATDARPRPATEPRDDRQARPAGGGPAKPGSACPGIQSGPRAGILLAHASARYARG